MKDLRLFAGVALCLLAVSSPLSAAARTEPSEEALKLVRGLRARAMGVDRAGNLWAWSPGPAAVDVISPSGARLARYSVAGAQAVDADSELGLAGLFREGSLLQWFSRDGKPAGEIRLAGPATGIRWIGEARVALTPQTAAHRIEVWDLRSRKLIHAWGKETPLQPGIGATRLRGVLLEYDWERKLLYSLESFTGELQVWSDEGRLAWSGQVENPNRKTWEDWLVKVDQKAKGNQDVQTPLILTLSGTLDSQGRFWVGLKAELARGEATLVKMSPEGSQLRTIQDEPCPSVDFMFWGGWLISYRAPQRQPCTATRRFL